MKRLALFGFVIAALLAITSPVYGDDTHAKEILKQAREAVGGENEADSPFSLPSNNFNLRADRGPSANDFHHLISAFINKRLKKGFAASAIVQATSALPYNIDRKSTRLNSSH